MPMCGSSFSERTETRGHWRWKTPASPTSLNASRWTHFASQTSSAWESSPKYEPGTTTQVSHSEKIVTLHGGRLIKLHFVKAILLHPMLHKSQLQSVIRMSLAAVRHWRLLHHSSDWSLTFLVYRSWQHLNLLYVLFLSWSHYAQVLLLAGIWNTLTWRMSCWTKLFVSPVTAGLPRMTMMDR